MATYAGLPHSPLNIFRGVKSGATLPSLPMAGLAIRTFDLTVRYMLLVHGLGGMFRAQDFRSFVALEALAFRDVAVSDNDIHMASLTGHASCHIFAVIEVPAFDLNISFGFNMARGTTPHSTGDALLLSS